MDYLQYTARITQDVAVSKVLNLVINGLPSISKEGDSIKVTHMCYVLNLVINGLPSI